MQALPRVSPLQLLAPPARVAVSPAEFYQRWQALPHRAALGATPTERGPLGDRIVHDTPNGKMVDYSEVMKMTPGAITELNNKVRALEKALGKAA